MKRNNKKCDKCFREISLSNFNKHYKSCKYVNGVKPIKERRAWNKGLTKADSNSIIKQAERQSKTKKNLPHTGFIKGSKHSDKTKNIMSLRACNRLKNHSKYSKNIEYNNIILESTYELEVAKILDILNISWEKIRHGYEWNDNGKKRRYVPDFYLPDFNIFLDPKNDYLIKKDARKIKSACELNNIVVLVLSKKDFTEDVIYNKIVGAASGQAGRLISA